MKTKLDRFADALQKRNPDDALVDFFNDTYDEAEANERYIAELEWVQLGHDVRTVTTIQLLADCKRVRLGAERTLKEFKRIRI